MIRLGLYHVVLCCDVLFSSKPSFVSNSRLSVFFFTLEILLLFAEMHPDKSETKIKTTPDRRLSDTEGTFPSFFVLENGITEMEAKSDALTSIRQVYNSLLEADTLEEATHAVASVVPLPVLVGAAATVAAGYVTAYKVRRALGIWRRKHREYMMKRPLSSAESGSHCGPDGDDPAAGANSTGEGAVEGGGVGTSGEPGTDTHDRQSEAATRPQVPPNVEESFYEFTASLGVLLPQDEDLFCALYTLVYTLPIPEGWERIVDPVQGIRFRHTVSGTVSLWHPLISFEGDNIRQQISWRHGPPPAPPVVPGFLNGTAVFDWFLDNERKKIEVGVSREKGTRAR